MFDSEFKNAVEHIKKQSTTMIGNGYQFSILSVDISKSATIQNDENETENVTVYPSTSDLSSWLTDLFNKELKYKQLPEKALAALKEKGLPVKKQPVEILNIIICSSSTDVIILEHDPNEIYSESGSQVRIKPSKEPFKEKDQIMSGYFDTLTRMGIYTREDED